MSNCKKPRITKGLRCFGRYYRLLYPPRVPLLAELCRVRAGGVWPVVIGEPVPGPGFFTNRGGGTGKTGGREMAAYTQYISRI